MKIAGAVSILALSLLSLPLPRPAAAQTPGAIASGTFRFLLEDETVKSLDVDARTDEKGVATGQMTFVDEARLPDVDDPEDPRAGDPPPSFYVKTQIDSLTVEKNRALLRGTVLDSSHRTYIGKWVQLVLEDTGDGLRVPDNLTWSFCARQTAGWVPSDAERRADDGAYLRWWATDAERKDDVGIPSKSLLPGEDQGCTAYPLWFYSFADVQKWDGDLLVVQR